MYDLYMYYVCMYVRTHAQWMEDGWINGCDVYVMCVCNVQVLLEKMQEESRVHEQAAVKHKQLVHAVSESEGNNEQLANQEQSLARVRARIASLKQTLTVCVCVSVCA